MVNIGSVYRELLVLYQDQIEEQVRLRPDLVDIVHLALREFFERHGLWPPPDHSS